MSKNYYLWVFMTEINCHKYNMTKLIMGIYLYNPKSIICQIQNINYGLLDYFRKI